MNLFKYILLIFIFVMAGTASAAILTSEGNRTFVPLSPLDLPAGAERLVNRPEKIGYWEGPPFGGGLHVVEFNTTSTSTANEALKDFSRIKAPALKLVLESGPRKSNFFDGHPYYQDQDTTPPKLNVDYSFSIWNSDNYHRLHQTTESAKYATGSASRSGNPVGSQVDPPTLVMYLSEGRLTYDGIRIPSNLLLEDRRTTNTDS